MSAGSKHIIALINCPGETINNANIETTIPDTAKIRSNGLNMLNINLFYNVCQQVLKSFLMYLVYFLMFL